MNKHKVVVPHGIELTDIITPISCSYLVAELIKYLAYNKQQIPYPYERLKMFVLKRRERQKVLEISNSSQDTERTSSSRDAFMMEKYYTKIEEAFEILDRTFRCIENKLLESNTYPIDEIVLLFGATPVSSKDVYRIKIPQLSFGHSERQHLWKRQIANLFRGIILSDEVNTNLQRKVGLTNMFVMLKMKKREDSDYKWLLPKDHYQLPQRAQQVCFSFRTVSSKPCDCCLESNQFEVLSESMEVLRVMESDKMDVQCSSEVSSPDEDFVWFQTERSLKGFKDCKSQGKSITDLWYIHKFIS